MTLIFPQGLTGTRTLTAVANSFLEGPCTAYLLGIYDIAIIGMHAPSTIINWSLYIRRTSQLPVLCIQVQEYAIDNLIINYSTIIN